MPEMESWRYVHGNRHPPSCDSCVLNRRASASRPTGVDEQQLRKLGMQLWSTENVVLAPRGCACTRYLVVLRPPVERILSRMFKHTLRGFTPASLVLRSLRTDVRLRRAEEELPHAPSFRARRGPTTGTRAASSALLCSRSRSAPSTPRTSSAPSAPSPRSMW